MSRSTVVIDACLAITHGKARALDLLTALHRHDVVIARRAVGEVTRQPAKGQLAKAIACGHLGVAAIEPQDAAEDRMTVKEAVERVGGLDVGEGLLRRLVRAERSVEEVLESRN